LEFLKLEDKLKIAWFSNHPFAPTGYGVVTKNIIFGPALEGGLNTKAKCDIISFYGTDGFGMEYNGVRIWPRRFDPYGRDICELVLKYVKPDIFFTLFDIWITYDDVAKNYWLNTIHPRWCGYIPVDHRPVPDGVAEPASHGYRPIAMSKFGQEEFDKRGIKTTYIPHGCNTEIFKPLDKKKARKALGFEDDWFIIGINAANKGMRKDYPRMFEAVRKFFDDNPDAEKKTRIYAHTWPQYPDGLPLANLVDKFGLRDKTIFTSDIKRLYGMSEGQLAEYYNVQDVYLNLSRGEGFGIPIIEAQSCGVPCIVTNFSSMPELVCNHGWKVQVEAYEMTPLMAYQALASVHHGAECIGQAYNKPQRLAKYSKMARQFALGYDWKTKILPMWYNLVEDIQSDIPEQLPFMMPKQMLESKVKMEKKR